MHLRRRANGIGKVAVWEWSRGVLTDPADPTVLTSHSLIVLPLTTQNSR
jgi:hypothetical protein